MPYVPKSQSEQFESDWSKAVAWSTSQGISAASYLPVYQLDLKRLQNGEYPMGVAQRNLEILAAHDPNQVTSAPQDNPQGSLAPSAIFGNAVSDAGKIATGLAGIFTGSFEKNVWDSAKATLEDVIHPARLNGPTIGDTISNWLGKTLAAYLPGASDLSQLLGAPGGGELGLGGDQGAKDLLAHPLVSLLDLLGVGEGGVLGKVSTDYAAEAARQGGILKAIGEIKLPRSGVSLKPGEVALVEQLSVKDVITKMAARLGPGGAGVGPALSDLGSAYNMASQMGATQFDWLMEGPARAVAGLDPDQVKLLGKILGSNDKTLGESVRAALDDPALDPQVKNALTQMIDGPKAFAVEAQILSGDLRPVRTLDGREGLYLPNEAAHKAVFDAVRTRDLARLGAMKALSRLEPHVEATAALEAELVKGTRQFHVELLNARKAVAADADPSLLGNATQDLAKPTKFRAKRGISKSAQVHAVVDEGGLADQMLDRIRENHDPVQIKAVAKAMKSRLSRWGPKSVDASASPALAALATTADALIAWADLYQKEGDAVDRAINGEVETQRELFRQHSEYRDLQMQSLRARHVVERENLEQDYERKMATIRGRFTTRLSQQMEYKTYATAVIEAETETAGERATKPVLDQLMAREKVEKSRINDNVRNSVIDARKDLEAKTKLARVERQRDLLKMTKRQETEVATLTKVTRFEKAGMGDVMREVEGYAKAVNKFQEAVADHPPDEYRDVKVMLMQKHMLASEHSAELIGQTLKHADEIKMSAGQIAKLRADPKLLGEYMVTRFDEIFMQPTISPEVSEMAQKALTDASKSGMEELKLLIRQGLRVEYIPAATDIDAKLSRDSVAPIIGHGIPKTDMTKARVWDMTPQLHDFAVGIKKAAIQQIQRDATIELTEHYLNPMTLTKAQVANFIDKTMNPLDKDLGGNLALQSRHMTAESLGLTAFDPESLFGFRLPRWGHDEVYLPTPIVNALKQLMSEKRQNVKVLSSSTKLFRYSILGLSPRYDAHIIFGGAMMGALRSSPYALKFIGDAAKALRDGALPEELAGRHAVEEGGQKAALTLYNRQAAKDLHQMALDEHIEQRQKIVRAAAKPVHMLRAAADLNFRFTRYVRDLQAAVVYFDGAAKAERRFAKIAVEDPVTGKVVKISPDRAMAAGMRAVESVYGNLGKMAPFERQIAQTMMPFYGWEKHILSYVFSFPFDHPWRSTVLSQMAFNASQQVPLAYPTRIQLLYFLGSPDSQGNVNAIDIRSLDPFRDVANYASWTGFFESLNPAIGAPLAMAFGSGAVYGSSSLYPTVSYNSFYGIETANSQGDVWTGLQQWIPQVGAAQTALQAVSGTRSLWNTDRSAAVKSILENLNIPFVTPPVNLKQIAAEDEGARYKVAATVAYNAFQSGDFSTLKGYSTVPNPLNPAYEITPAALQQLYEQAQQATPGVAPIESLLPPPTPYGW
jgi:hypothetical protein